MRIVLVLSLGVAMLAAAASAQAPAPADGNELLVETKGLRADLNQAMSASIRAQLMVSRLQLQEQRMNALTAQLADVRKSLANDEAEQGKQADDLKRFEDMLRGGDRELAADQRKDVEGMVAMLKAELARVRPQQQALRNQEAELSGQLSSEQGRWIYFNDRLDEIERSLPAGRSR